MLESIASLIKKVADADVTPAGKALMDLTTKFIRTNPEVMKAKAIQEKKDLCAKLGQVLIEELKKTESHGTSPEATKEFVETVTGLIRDGNLKKLMEYPYNWALAWKYKVNKEAAVQSEKMKTSFSVLGAMGNDATKLLKSGVAPDDLMEKLYKLSDECISDMEDLMHAWRKENKDDSKEIFGY